MTIVKRGEQAFRPRARLLVLLGEQLITNEIIATVELVKNAYDADATRAIITLSQVDDINTGKIILEDNGSGMSLDTILNIWLEPATDFRKKQREHGQRTPIHKRIPLGEKGVGRFAAHKLGTLVEVVTRAEGSKEETIVLVDWGKFEGGGYLDDIPIRWETRTPSVFTGKNSHGTCITVAQLRKKWTEDMVRQFYVMIQGLSSPFEKLGEFRVEVRAPGLESVLEEMPHLDEVLDTAIYKFDGEVDSEGWFTSTYNFYNQAFPKFKRSIQEEREDVRDKRYFEGLRKPRCGPFRIRFYVWERDTPTLRETMDAGYFREAVDPHTGVRVYRDGFRVWPYGEKGDDWLGLDLRRVQYPTLRLSRNQIIGIVEISCLSNPELRDKTDREGLIENEQLIDFQKLVLGCVAVLERERRKDKDRIDRLREKKKPGDEVQRNINHLRERMVSKKHIELYKGDLRRIETSYRTRMREVVEPLIVAAGLGLSYVLPVHEILRNVGDAEKMLKETLSAAKEKRFAGEVVDQLNQLLQTLNILEGSVRGIGRISRKGRVETLTVISVVKDALDIMSSRLKKDDIKIEEQILKILSITGQRNLIVTAILNLIDNSNYWLLHRPSARKIIIAAESTASDEVRLTVSDNGPGIRDAPELLVEPFYTRKPDGSGLGLYIVDRIMKAHRGRIEFLDKWTIPKGILEGANISLVFPPAEVKKE